MRENYVMGTQATVSQFIKSRVSLPQGRPQQQGMPATVVGLLTTPLSAASEMRNVITAARRATSGRSAGAGPSLHNPQVRISLSTGPRSMTVIRLRSTHCTHSGIQQPSLSRQQ
ncbi:MAG: hypothetical protein OXC41_01685 [Gammaproteobacteria bacterium]|nr:hypothetical protein [Gammaproteobacteria bacterium]